MISIVVCGTLTLVATICVSAAASDDTLAAADRLRLTGRYAEAEAIYHRWLRTDPQGATIGLAESKRAVGKLDEAAELLKSAAAQDPTAAVFPAAAARLAFERGNYEAARGHADASLNLDDKQLLARWIDAELHRVTGQLERANESYRWFVQFYNGSQEQIRDPEALRLVGLAAAQCARWNRNSSQFSFLVNRLYPKCLELNKDYWPSHLAAALLFLEKYNEADAARELDAALAINPDAAEVHAARAQLALQKFDLEAASVSIDRALEINPRLVEAHRLQAELCLANFRLRDAAVVLEQTTKFNPVDEETLGSLAAVYGALDGLPADPAGTRMAELIHMAIARNEHCGEFFFALAETLEQLRKYPQAAVYYDEAQRRMPQLVGVPSRLGLIYMWLGEEGKAARLLEESFRIDPFNVRVKNMLEVLDLLKSYAVLETDHFVIKFDRGQDELLAQYAAKFLEEEVYPDIVAKLSYQPVGKTLLEIFNRSGSTSGHSWFSARMVGLPYVGTVAACAGKTVALTSPHDMPQPYNWARVLRHEFVHVVNLQQTDFNIPHWFTEALAVWHEGFPRPRRWDQVLAQRADARTLFNLDTINSGFVQPGRGDDWTLAYCQAELYARFMTESYGADALTKMLAAYADNLSTGDAIRRCFGVSQEQFEGAYQDYVTKWVQAAALQTAKPTRSFAELQKAVKEHPDRADLIAQLAYLYLQREANPEARRHALQARRLDDKQQLAAYVLARLYLSIGDTQQALRLLESTLDEYSPQENALGLLAGLRLKAEQFDEAARLYELGVKRFPYDDKWLRSLARTYLLSNDNPKLVPTLHRLAEQDADDVTLRKKLAHITLAQNDFSETARWANQALQINVMDAEVHAMLAAALAGLGELKRSIDQYETAIHLEPDQLSWRLALAETCIRANDRRKARTVLAELSRISPDYPRARDLLESVQP